MPNRKRERATPVTVKAWAIMCEGRRLLSRSEDNRAPALYSEPSQAYVYSGGRENIVRVTITVDKAKRKKVKR